MNAEQIRARLLEIQTELEAIVAVDNQFSDEQVEKVNALDAEHETLSKQLATVEKLEAMKAKSTTSAGRKTAPGAPAPRIEVGANRATDRFGGFNSTGDFLMAVKKAGATGEVDNRFKNTAYEKQGEDGGFLIPEEMSSEILKKLESKESLMSATTQLQVSGNALTLNVDESQPWNQGVQAYWLAEGAPLTESKAAFKQASWRLHKVGALVKATDELLDDATALESYIKVAAPAAIMHKINGAILAGNGAGKPVGIINSPFTYTVSKESMQSADTIVARNVLNMHSRMLPNARANAAWFINAGCESQLLTMVDDNDNFMYISPGGLGSQISNSPFGSLMGRPVIPMMSGMPALGDLGDIIFADLSYYYMIVKAGGIKSASSIHLNFDREITAFRFTMRVDGKCPFQSAVTTEFGNHSMSAFVQLEAR